MELSKEHERYIRQYKRRKWFIRCMQLTVLIVIIVAWELCAEANIIDPFITSSPSRIVSTIARLYADGDLFLHIGVTMYETVMGFLLGTLVGTIIAILLWWSDTLCKVFDPYLVVLNALPKIALGPVLIVWIGSGTESIIVMALLISLVVTIMTVLSGFTEENSQKKLLMDTLRASKWQMFIYAVLPAGIPTIVSALKLSVGMSWVGVIVGEYLVSKAGLGYLIVYGGQVFKLDLVMASIVILCVLATIMYYLVAWLEMGLKKWRMR